VVEVEVEVVDGGCEIVVVMNVCGSKVGAASSAGLKARGAEEEMPLIMDAGAEEDVDDAVAAAVVVCELTTFFV